jgi:hypothetical protein
MIAIQRCFRLKNDTKTYELLIEMYSILTEKSRGILTSSINLPTFSLKPIHKKAITFLVSLFSQIY